MLSGLGTPQHVDLAAQRASGSGIGEIRSIRRDRIHVSYPIRGPTISVDLSFDALWDLPANILTRQWRPPYYTNGHL